MSIFDWIVNQSDILPTVARGESTSLRQLLRALVDADYAAPRTDSIFESWETQTCAASDIYDRLDGGLERRLYELARKHCGRQPSWTVGLDLLHKKTGSAASLRKFRQLVKQSTGSNLPEYDFAYQGETDQAVFTRRLVSVYQVRSGHKFGPSGTHFRSIKYVASVYQVRQG